jgi:hypothetical protein
MEHYVVLIDTRTLYNNNLLSSSNRTIVGLIDLMVPACFRSQFRG